MNVVIADIIGSSRSNLGSLRHARKWNRCWRLCPRTKFHDLSRWADRIGESILQRDTERCGRQATKKHATLHHSSTIFPLDALDLAAIHTYGNSGHPLPRGRYDITNEVGNFFRFSEASDPSLLWKLLDRLFHRHVVRGRPFFEESLSASSHHRSRRDAVDLYAVFNSLLRKCLRECIDSSIDRCDCGKSGFGIERCSSRHQHHRSVCSLQSIPSSHCQTARTMEFKRYTVIPLRVRHLKQVNLRNCARDVEQRIDSAKTLERTFDDDLRRLWLAQVKSVNTC